MIEKEWHYSPASFNPAGFADAVEDYVHADAHCQELIDGEWIDDLEDYILGATYAYYSGGGFTPCTGCSEC